MMELVKVDSKVKISLNDGTVRENNYFKLGKYEVEEYTVTYDDGKSYKRIAVSEDWNERYLPRIEYCDDILGEKAPEFKIQTTAYGALKPEEIKKVIEGYQEALEAVEILTANFC